MKRAPLPTFSWFDPVTCAKEVVLGVDSGWVEQELIPAKVKHKLNGLGNAVNDVITFT